MTNTTEANETALLKTDGLGRVRTRAARRESLLDEFERSGLSGAKFAALVGIRYPTFATWAQRRRRQRGGYVGTNVPTPATCKVRWLEAVVEQAQSWPRREIRSDNLALIHRHHQRILCAARIAAPCVCLAFESSRVIGVAYQPPVASAQIPPQHSSGGGNDGKPDAVILVQWHGFMPEKGERLNGTKGVGTDWCL
jgi:hypothetical protein